MLVGGPGGEAQTRVEIVAIQEANGEIDGPVIKPQHLAAFEDACRTNTDLGGYQCMLQAIWEVMTYLAQRHDDEERRESTQQARQSLQEIYEALLPIYEAAKVGELPIPEEEREDRYRRFDAAARAFRRSGGVEKAPFWAFVEWGTDWFNAVCVATPDDDIRLLLFAVMEACNTVLRHEPVWGGPIETDERERTRGPVFVTRSVGAAASSADARMIIVDSALERATQTRWRYITRLARGQTASYHDLAVALRGHPDTAHVQYAVTDDGTVAYLVFGTPEGDTPSGRLPALHGEQGFQVFTSPDLTLATLRDLLVAGPDGWFPCYRNRGQRGGFATWLAVMDRTLPLLYERLISPLLPVLQRAGVKDLQIIPHRGLHLIPWAALYRKDKAGQRHFLVDDYEISLAPSTTILEICRERAAQRKQEPSLTAIANPTGDLPLADDEVTPLSRLLPADRQQVWRRDQALRTVVAQAAPSSLWHFAGHGRYDWSDPLASCLLFAGRERLPLGDLFAEAMLLSETNLAVLSACETDVTDPEDLADEYLGLASGFLFAGTPAVISTLWAVDDVSTALLMDKFYEKYLTEGQRPAQALRAAQLWLRDEVDEKLVSTRIESVLTDLKQRRSQTSDFSEEAPPLDRQIKRLKGRLERLRKRKGSGIGNRPFAHPYYWAAFTLAGAAPAAKAET